MSNADLRSRKRDYARARYATAEGREAHRERMLRHRYGIGLAQVRAMYESQEGCCAICSASGEIPYSLDQRGPGGRGALILDHDHSTGDLRGLLCRRCNTGLGQFGDSMPTLVKAAAYLGEHTHGN